MRAPPTHDTHIARHTYSPPYQGFLVVFSHQPPAPAPGAAPPTSTPYRTACGTLLGLFGAGADFLFFEFFELGFPR